MQYNPIHAYNIIGFIDAFFTVACAWHDQDELCCRAKGETGNWHAIPHLRYIIMYAHG